MSFMSSFIDFGCRRNLKLACSNERCIGYRDAPRDVQFDLRPSLFPGRVDSGPLLRLGTGFDNITVSIVPNDSGDLGVSGLAVLRDHGNPDICQQTRTVGKRDDECKTPLRLKLMRRNMQSVPHDFVYLWDLARVQERV